MSTCGWSTQSSTTLTSFEMWYFHQKSPLHIPCTDGTRFCGSQRMGRRSSKWNVYSYIFFRWRSTSSGSPPPWNFHDIIHGFQRLAHHITIPFNFSGNDVNLPDSGPTIYIPVEFPYMTKTSREGLSYWNEPLASVYEGMGLAFPMAGYHDILQIPVHNQAYEILCCDLFVINRALSELVHVNCPNETISDADHNHFITHMDPNNGDIFCCMNIIDGFNDYWYQHQSTQPLPGFDEIPTQQFWNQIIDTRWQSIWKRKNPWYNEWRNLCTSADINERQIIAATSIHHPLSNRRSTHWLLLKQEAEWSDDNVRILQRIVGNSHPLATHSLRIHTPWPPSHHTIPTLCIQNSSVLFRPHMVSFSLYANPDYVSCAPNPSSYSPLLVCAHPNSSVSTHTIMFLSFSIILLSFSMYYSLDSSQMRSISGYIA